MLDINSGVKSFFAWLFYQDDFSYSSNVWWEIGVGYKVGNLLFESPYTTSQIYTDSLIFTHNDDGTFTFKNVNEIRLTPLKEYDEMEIPTVVFLKSNQDDQSSIVYYTDLPNPIENTNMTIYFAPNDLIITFKSDNINLMSDLEWQIAYSQFNLKPTALYTPKELRIGLWTTGSNPPFATTEPSAEFSYEPARIRFNDMAITSHVIGTRSLHTCTNIIDIEFPVYLGTDEPEISYFYLFHVDTDDVKHILCWGELDHPVKLVNNAIPLFAANSFSITTNGSYLD